MKTLIQIDDFRVIVRGLMAAYPRDNFIPDEYTFNLWYTALQDIDYPTLNKAATAYIMSNHYPPAIADIRQLAYDMVTPADDIAAEEWAKLMKALGYAGSPESFDHWQKLPETTKEIIGGFSEFKEWGNTKTADLMSVQRPMFIKRYEEKTKKKRLIGPLPGQLQPPTKRIEAYTPPAIEAKEDPKMEKLAAPVDLMARLRARLGA